MEDARSDKAFVEGTEFYKERPFRLVIKDALSVGKEYYADVDTIYDPSDPNGLADGAAEQIAALSTRDGEVILYSWDEASHRPLQFEYRRGMYRVIYTDTPGMNYSGEAEGTYVVYYSFELLRFEAE